jgi:hypothetical protein
VRRRVGLDDRVAVPLEPAHLAGAVNWALADKLEGLIAGRSCGSASTAARSTLSPWERLRSRMRSADVAVLSEVPK